MSEFRTTEISDPAFESKNQRFITVKSNNLKGRGDICLFVPETNGKDLPLVILLHGVYGSAWAWSQKGGACNTASRLIENGDIEPMVLAMPSDGLWGDGSAYLPHHQIDFEKWIAEDVPAAVIENIEGVTKDSKLFIAGLSMGGFGAIRIGAKYGKKISGISGHSSITKLEQMAEFIEEPLEGFAPDFKKETLLNTLIQNSEKLPPMRFDCGRSDPLVEANRELNESLTKLKFSHYYEEFEGGHEWSYWIEHLEKTLLFFNSI